MNTSKKETTGSDSASGTNWENRTLFHGDNLGFLRAMNSESVDLIATDPPFNKNKDFHATPDSLAAGAKFQDRWSWERDVHQDWTDKIKDDSPELMEAIESARYAHSDGMGAFMCFMSVRLMEMRRLLKPTGSVYLHCDPTASHYLKAIMDAIFGRDNFRNEIIWSYKSGGGSKKQFGKKHDVIFWYSKSHKKWIFNVDDMRVPYDAVIPEKYREKFHEGGKVLGSVWEVSRPPNHSKEWIGYPTQKPLALYERIVQASSNKGDIVLDPFCGCATTLVAAERLGRQWIGIDLWDEAHEAVVKRLSGDTSLGVPEGFEENRRLYYDGQIHYEKTPPERTDDGEEAAPFMPTIQARKKPKESWQKMSHEQMMKELEKAQGTPNGLVVCVGCGREVELPFMELDHIQPRSERGANDISNRVLLCGPCNKRKSNKLTLAGLLGENKKAGWMKDKKMADRAKRHAYDHYVRIKEGRIQWEEQKP